ncbi:hypothetical protein [Marinicella sp. W31]|uniref:hypothetical protein n=1 Tax=Marinicella sp. W31 TaxID=3023713 RepID=UPI00375707E0
MMIFYKRVGVLLLMFSGYVSASNLVLDEFFPIEMTNPITMGCQGLIIPTNDNQTSCSNTNNLAFNQCPLLVIDDYSYPASNEFSIFHQSRLITVNSSQASNCVSQSSGNSPSFNGPFLLIIGSSSIGITDLYIDVDRWALVMRSADRDLECDNGTYFNGDLIFNNSYEVQQ